MSAALRAAGLAALLIALDQATKAYVRANLDRTEREAILPGVEIVNGRNTGVAFGLLEGSGAIIGVVSVVAVAALLVFFAVQRTRRPGIWVPTGLLLGGAIGNLIDRLTIGHVTDWVDMGIGTWRWYTFNVADASISIALVLLLASALFGERLTQRLERRAA